MELGRAIGTLVTRMILEIVQYGNPPFRHVSKRVSFVAKDIIGGSLPKYLSGSMVLAGTNGDTA